MGVVAFDDMFAKARPVVNTVVRQFASGALVYREFSAIHDARLSAWQLSLYGGLNLGMAKPDALFDLTGITVGNDIPVAGVTSET